MTQIQQNNTIPKGYKQTEIGLIPEDWEVEKLDEVLKFGSGQDYKHLSKGDIPVFGTGGIMTFVNNHLYEGESVGIGRKGTIDKPVFLTGKFWTVDTLFYTHNFVKSIPKYIYYKFLLVPWKEYNEASGVPSLNKNTLGKIKISLPSIQEQQAIAQVLSDTDRCIESIAQLITKKKAIKQGAMQELLTGKKRLTGFDGEWETKKLGEVGKTISGLSGKTKEDFGVGTSRYITFMNVMSNVVIDIKVLEKVNIKPNESQNTFFKGDLFFNTSSETPEEVGMCAILLENIESVYLNSFCFGYRLNHEKLDGLFLSYLINSNVGRSIFKNLAQGATRYNLSKINFNNVILKVPKDKQEQQAIAQILSDMDAEIEALTAQLHKTKALKQGLIQELLTGKTRLVKPYSQEDNDELRMVAESVDNYKSKK